EHASTVRKMVHSGSSSMKNKLKIDLFSDTRHAVVEVDNVSLAAKLVDLPCVIGSLKTLDRKSFYKTADVSQVIAEDETKEIESQGSIPGYAIASGMRDYKQRHPLPEYYVLQEMRNDSSNNTEEDDKDEEEEEDYDDEEEEDYYDEDMERELQTRFTEYDQYEAKEGTSSMVMEIQKYTQYAEKMLHEIQRRAQRQKDLIRKVENLTLKNHLHSVLEQLKLQEEEKTEQVR
ncbi:PREDICTED: transcription initiation factor TFIID subunit 7-like, partial [Bison bison bison]|uniref:Transcription initiation factor TFIID subunit 7-like n=1 Tax=Bison bison bison TaxID=43346 RepID=A0A6P3IL96_BISBB